MCASLKLRRSDEPRCPDVPNDTCCAGSNGSGASPSYAASSSATSTCSSAGTGLPASGCTLMRCADSARRVREVAHGLREQSEPACIRRDRPRLALELCHRRRQLSQSGATCGGVLQPLEPIELAGNARESVRGHAVAAPQLIEVRTRDDEVRGPDELRLR